MLGAAACRTMSTQARPQSQLYSWRTWGVAGHPPLTLPWSALCWVRRLCTSNGLSADSDKHHRQISRRQHGTKSNDAAAAASAQQRQKIGQLLLGGKVIIW